MPPAVVAAGIAGATTLGGALIQSHAAGNAGKAQQHATDQALQFQREQAAEAQRRYNQEYAGFEKRHDAWENQRNAILEHYGIHTPSPAPLPTRLDGSGATATRVPGAGLSLGSLMPPAAAPSPGIGPGPLSTPLAEPDQGAMAPQRGMTLGDLPDWADWNRSNRYAS